MINVKKSFNFLFLQLTDSPCFSTCGWQPAQVQLWWQPACRARVVHSHHPYSVDQWCWRYWHRLGQQDPQLRHTRDHQQHPPDAQRWWASAHGEDKIWLLSEMSILFLLINRTDDKDAFSPYSFQAIKASEAQLSRWWTTSTWTVERWPSLIPPLLRSLNCLLKPGHRLVNKGVI